LDTFNNRVILKIILEMRDELRKLVYYIIWKSKCIHLYRISRILVLANWNALESIGHYIIGFSINGFEAAFSIDELAGLKSDDCININEDARCMEYTCMPPKIDDDVRKIIDDVIESTRDLDDSTLNRLVIKDKRYRELLEKGGFH